MQPVPKKRKSTISNDLRLGIWDVYMGRGYKTKKCLLCGVANISRSTTAGFESAHMIADKFMSPQCKLSIYYLIPSCTACNSSCKTLCVLDYLYIMRRYKPLRECIRSICMTYVQEHDALREQDRLWAEILKLLYGPDTWKAGGGLVNENQIYRFAQEEQYNWLNEREEELLKEQKKIMQEKIYLSEHVTVGAQINTLR